MRNCAALFGALILSACMGSTEPTVVYVPQEIKLEVPVSCPIDVPTTEGPDFAASDSNIEYAALYAEGRIVALRTEVDNLREAIQACEDASGSESNNPS